MRKDIGSWLKLTTLLAPVVKNSDTDCTAVDLAGYEGVDLCVTMGDSADTLNGTNKISLELEESDDNLSFTDVDDDDMIGLDEAGGSGTSGQFALVDAPTEDSVIYRIGYRGTKRYVRVVLNFSGTHSTGTPIGVFALLGAPRTAPVSRVGA